MSEKVVITQEQKNMINELMSAGNKDQVLERHADRILNKGYHVESLKVLNDIKVFEMAKILYAEEYEIKPDEPKFQAGDKVFFDNQILTLETPAKNPLGREGNEGVAWRLKEVIGWLGENQTRRATEDEIFWLHELGRDKVMDFQEGDVVVDTREMFFIVSETKVDDDRVSKALAKSWYEIGAITGIYPAESFKPFSKEGNN